MKFNDRKLSMIFILLCMIMILSTSCVSYSTLQTPETLEPGQVSLGVGAMAFFDFDRDDIPLGTFLTLNSRDVLELLRVLISDSNIRIPIFSSWIQNTNFMMDP